MRRMYASSPLATASIACLSSSGAATTATGGGGVGSVATVCCFSLNELSSCSAGSFVSVMEGGVAAACCVASHRRPPPRPAALPPSSCSAQPPPPPLPPLSAPSTPRTAATHWACVAGTRPAVSPAPAAAPHHRPRHHLPPPARLAVAGWMTAVWAAEEVGGFVGGRGQKGGWVWLVECDG